jgi:hypothetical protein
MGRSYQQFSFEDRCEIARRRAGGEPVRQIAAALDRAPSSVSRELKRDRGSAAAEDFRWRSVDGLEIQCWLNFVANIRGRLLIVQGLNGPNVTPVQVDIVRECLDRARIPYDVLTFADEGHGIAKPANRRLLLRRLAAFFAATFV